MRIKFTLLFFALLIGLGISHAQVSITNTSSTAIINFSNTMQTTVGTSPSTAYEGDGFQLNPTTAGRLNTNAWEVKGWSYGDVLFGSAGITVDDLGRGSVTGGVITPGMYAYTDAPSTVANPAMLIQSSPGDFEPGTVALRIKNNGTAPITQFAVSYNLYLRNDENSSSAFNFSHSNDNVVYENEPALDYVSPDIADLFQWNNIGVSPSRSLIITGINVLPGAYYYLRWSTFKVTGTGASDEFGIDDITITGTYGAPAPEINLTCYGNTILSGDISPTVGKGTEFSTSYAPTSTINTTQLISFEIQNLGGLPLNISSVTVSGANPGDFLISGVTTGTLAAGTVPVSTISFIVTFDPTDEGLRKARINIANNDANENPYFFDVQGYGIIPIPDIRINATSPGPGASIVTDDSMIPNLGNNTLFGNKIVGVETEIHGFAIRNDCPQNAAVVLTDPPPYITITGANPSDFTISTGITVGSPAPNIIFPGYVRNFAIQFAPTAAGIRSALITINNNTPGSEGVFTYLVQGVGIAPEADVSGNSQPVISGSTSTSLTNHTFFDYLNINTGTVDRTFTIKNSSTTATLTIGALTLTGANAADFSIISNPPSTLAVGANATFTIRFDPSTVGLRTATVNLVNNDPDENPYNFAISGYGVDYVPCSFAAVETIALQDFESPAGAPVWTYTTTGTTTVAGGVAYGSNGDGGTSNRFLGARSFQVINGTGVLTTNIVSTIDYSDVELNFRLASLSLTSAEGSDLADVVTVAVSSNGGSTWSDELQVSGNLDAKWNFVSGSATATAVYDNNNLFTTISPSTGGYLTSTGVGTILLTGLPKTTNLQVRITLKNNSVNEIWALDNLSLFGRKETSTTWDGAAWSAGAPTTTVKAIIDGAYSTAVNGNFHACKCEVKAGRTVTVGPNNYLDIEGEIINSGSIVVENNGTLMQHNDLASNLGIVKVKRFTTPMRQYDYTYWSSPVAGQTLFALSPSTLSDKYFSYNPVSGSWVTLYNGAAVMSAGKGYIIRAPQGFTSTPQAYTAGEFNGIPNNGFITTPIEIGVSTQNLIGNPYPSAINADAFLTYTPNVSVVEGTIYLWTHNTPITNNAYTSNDFAVYNIAGGVGTRAALNPGVNPNIPNGFIASGQGFVIKGKINGVATFINSMRRTGSNGSFFRSMHDNDNTANPALNYSETLEKHRVWLNLTNDQGAFKQTMIGYIEGATNEIDREFDGELYNANTFINFYSINGSTKLAIQGKALPFIDSDVVSLGYNSTTSGIFQIGIDQTDGILVDQNIYLEDKLLNVIVNLKESAYTFNTEIGTFDDRFMIKYQTSSLATSNFDTAGNAVVVSAKNKNIQILSQKENMKSVTVYDILGRVVFESSEVNNNKLTIPNVVSNEQALVVKIQLESGNTVTRKVVL